MDQNQLNDTITSADIQRFPSEWHDKIREYVAGAASGTYNVALKRDGTLTYLETKLCQPQTRMTINDFPSTLCDDGEYYYYGNRDASLPFQFGSSIRYHNCPIAPCDIISGISMWMWNPNHRKKYISIARKSDNIFVSNCACYNYLSVY